MENTKRFTITDKQATQKILNMIWDADADEFCTMVEKLCGVVVHNYDEEKGELLISPGPDYAGIFG